MSERERITTAVAGRTTEASVYPVKRTSIHGIRETAWCLQWRTALMPASAYWYYSN